MIAGYQKCGTNRVFDTETGEKMGNPIETLQQMKKELSLGCPGKEGLVIPFKMEKFQLLIIS
ncbi:MAG: hypothetical protein L6Q77_13490 [Bacteroidetes bacterium]|nr:hypothetical protein [Bacteroidota bacterium]